MIRVSVIIPTFNRKDYLREAIESVINQSFQSFEIIVVDDGSNDGTREMINNEFGSSIKYYWQENQGESVARNKGMQESQGEYIALLDSDDRWLNNKLEVQVNYLDDDPSSGMVFCQAWVIGDTGERIDSDPWGSNINHGRINVESLVFNNGISGPSSTLIRRIVFDSIGEFDPNIHYGEDWDLWLRIAENYKIGFINRPLVEVRRHQNTQCYFPSSKINKLRLDDHLLIIDKATQSWSDPSAWQIKEEAIANQYAQAFLAEAVVGNYQSSKELLRTTIGLSPELLVEPEIAGVYILNYCGILAQESNSRQHEAVINFIEWVFCEYESNNIHDKSFMNLVWAEVYSLLGFLSLNHNNFKDARNSFFRSMRYKPGKLVDRGFVAGMIISLLGKDKYGRMKKFLDQFK